ncbi:hypothetical protein BUZ15_14165 [Staphylococcus gallinarum]|uniref:Uncharacterized protein n=1 Tax=Staphylococcus gallinarum TaxID=1293 RepID=A0A2T4STN7_STAGA|nr:hypothetical protein [Staphylococcus gallinarum]PTL07516.1 hypothetical protein BUZ15_14165 [Staphylococcus gallinarum]RIL33166.1 hypothetical protein BUY98_08245 [Staphylococcus gallinarum]RIL41065.1 hypothetical protein BUZ01_13715 [Staphylococcus gallinarum]RIO94183.1 hypothetical protein BUZ04_03970 [Staphylococcus gallinarum]
MSYEEGTTIHRSTIKLLDKLDEYIKQRDQYKAERDTLINDLKVLREKNEELKEDLIYSGAMEDYWKIHADEIKEDLKEYYQDEITQYKQENERLVEEKDDILLEREYYNNGYKDMTRRGRELESKYTTLTNHIRQKAEANPNVDRYIALVNYIDRLDREEDER